MGRPDNSCVLYPITVRNDWMAQYCLWYHEWRVLAIGCLVQSRHWEIDPRARCTHCQWRYGRRIERGHVRLDHPRDDSPRRNGRRDNTMDQIPTIDRREQWRRMGCAMWKLGRCRRRRCRRSSSLRRDLLFSSFIYYMCVHSNIRDGMG